MDLSIRRQEKEKVKIPEKLIQATFDTIKAGIRLDEREREALLKADAKQNLEKGRHGFKRKDAAQKKQEKFLQTVQRKGSLDDGLPVERTYRAYEDRRHGISILADHHRSRADNELSGSAESLFLQEPPLDYSFCMLDNVNEIIGDHETAQTNRNFKHPRKSSDERYRTSSLLLSYNLFSNIDDLSNMLFRMLQGGPAGLAWLDLSFNCITAFDSEMLAQIPNLRILYLHGNSIADMLEVKKLKELTQLISLTLHGNPIEQEDGYRICVLSYLPRLKHLDFIGVTRGDRVNTCFAPNYETHWQRRHVELEAKAHALQNSEGISLTERLLMTEDDDDGEEDDDEGELYM